MNTFTATSVAEWRAWLTEHGQSETEVWLVIHHKDSGPPSPRYHEAVEQALCFGWIDGLHRKRDANTSQLRFTPRKARSTWSQVNRDRAAAMIASGKMTAHGQAVIDKAKVDGTWEVVLDSGLAEALVRNAAARENFEKFPPSSKRLIMEWVGGAKRVETRVRRIERAVELAAVNVRANHPGVRARG
ncbi:YdeI/OmpD-associated family protein [Actinokineospora xionganensis]|uniref:YdeI/OmpD-associated family protein n=1 Tax=Actinokineospora xionganensis TaxID=2684470 RepID=A0ABR7L7X9_9PSEU|nr:YdeI/OmpD-associated family protein [Actinokineospora xionganensis]MBC6448677.1 YdeI/OmpD-associated family protein [Actinokineospora xionganensis]